MHMGQTVQRQIGNVLTRAGISRSDPRAGPGSPFGAVGLKDQSARAKYRKQ
jgi:hypothetical protein